MDFQGLRVNARDWLNIDTRRLSDASLGMMINMAQREILRTHDLWQGEHEDTFETVQGTATYAVPTLFSRPFAMWYAHPSSGEKMRLLSREKDIFDTMFPDASKQGLPAYRAWWGGNIYLGPTPDRTLTVHRTYYGLLPDLVADDDTNALCENGWEAIVFRALTYATLYSIEDSRLPLWEAQAAKAENDLAREFRRARSVDRPAQSRIP